jgi:arsenite methyltransferase
MHYLHRIFDWHSKTIADAYDELPLWSAAPGTLLLEHIPYAGVRTALDIGCGTGFPLLLLARRLGPACRVIGVDPWKEAMERTSAKIAAWNLPNVELLECDAREIPLPAGTVDLITSNLGLNNFADVPAVLSECKRLLSPAGRLCLSTNLRGTFAEFYAAFRLAAHGDAPLLRAITAHENHRHTVETLEELMNANGFMVETVVKGEATHTYASGTAFLNDYFTVMGFLPDWKELVMSVRREEVFFRVEGHLNAVASREGRLRLTVPLAFLELRRK